MGRAVIISIILFVILIGAIIFVYYKYEKPAQENKIYLIDLSIFAKEGDKLIRTNYSVFSNGLYLGDGLTNEYGATLYKVPFNSTITIINSNLPGQKYYKNRVDLFTDKNETTRVNLDLISVGNLSINSNISNYKIYTEVSTPGYFKNTIVCLNWSIHVIFAEIIDLQKTTTLENNIKCYLGPTLNNNKFNFSITYNTFGTLNSEDYIYMNFYDLEENYTLRNSTKNSLVI